MSMQPASDRVVLITGGAGGIGSAMTLGLLGAGYRVVAIDVGDEPLAALVRAAGTAAQRLLTQRGDVRREEDCERVVRAALDRFGAVYGLVNNAGLGMRAIKEDNLQAPARFWEVDPERWQRVVDVNFRGPFLMARAASPHMIAQRRGRIVNVTTSLDTMLRGAYTPYGQSKAALEAATVSWARDLEGTGVTANVLIPGGAVNTAFFSPDAPLDRAAIMQPDIMVAPLCWLLSDAAETVTGRRYVARLWDRSLPAGEAAERAGKEAAWQALGPESAWPGGKPVR
jgi:3-oxoacyl-[acyl-carrier protein] reductase